MKTISLFFMLLSKSYKTLAKTYMDGVKLTSYISYSINSFKTNPSPIIRFFLFFILLSRQNAFSGELSCPGIKSLARGNCEFRSQKALSKQLKMLSAGAEGSINALKTMDLRKSDDKPYYYHILGQLSQQIKEATITWSTFFSPEFEETEEFAQAMNFNNKGINKVRSQISEFVVGNDDPFEKKKLNHSDIIRILEGLKIEAKALDQQVNTFKPNLEAQEACKLLPPPPKDTTPRTGAAPR